MMRGVSVTCKILVILFFGLLADTVFVSTSFAQCPIAASPSAGSYCGGGLGVAITASGGASGTVYTWSPAIGLSATTGTAVTATPGSSTVYTVTGTSPLGCVSIATSTITVYSVTPTIISVSTAEPSVCVGSPLHLNASISPSAGPYTYVWTGPDGYASTTGPTGSVTNSAIEGVMPALPVMLCIH